MDEWRNNQSQVLKEMEESVRTIRDMAVKTGETVVKLEALRPVLMLVEVEGERNNIYSAMHFVCDQFKLWLVKNPPSSSLVNSYLEHLTGQIEWE